MRRRNQPAARPQVQARDLVTIAAFFLAVAWLCRALLR